MKQITIVILLLLSLNSFAQKKTSIPKEHNRYFLVYYSFKAEEASGDGTCTFTTYKGRFINRDLCIDYIINSSKLREYKDSINVIIEYIYEFKSEQDYLDFTKNQ